MGCVVATHGHANCQWVNKNVTMYAAMSGGGHFVFFQKIEKGNHIKI
jgi:hypothetical protein